MARKRRRSNSDDPTAGGAASAELLAVGHGPRPAPPLAANDERTSIGMAATQATTAPPLTIAAGVPAHKVGRSLIYQRYPSAYDALMGVHDCSRLATHLLQLVEEVSKHKAGDDVSLADFGCGTGRVGAMVLPVVNHLYCYDQSPAMVVRCIENLTNVAASARKKLVISDLTKLQRSTLEAPKHHVWGAACATPSFVEPPLAQEDLTQVSGDYPTVTLRAGVISFEDMQLSTSAAPAPVIRAALPSNGSIDIAVAAWALSSVVNAQWGGNKWHDAVDATLRAMYNCCKEGSASPSFVVIVETLGTMSEEPTRKNTLHAYLVERHAFEFQWVRTDYLFPTLSDGERLCRFFFGDGVAAAYAAKGDAPLAECTGIWTKRIVAAPPHEGSLKTAPANGIAQ